MALELTDDVKQKAIESLRKYFELNMDEPLGNLGAGLLLTFFVEEIGPAIYNKGVADAQERMALRVSELDFEVHEDEFQYWIRQDKRKKR